MTAVTESPLPPHSRELKTNKPTAIGSGGEIVSVCLCVCVCLCDPLVVELQCERDAIILLCLREVIRSEHYCFSISSDVLHVLSC